MGRGLRAIIVGLTVVSSCRSGRGAGLAESAPGETGGRALGSRIAAGVTGNHVCAVKEDGTVRCWGSNSSGQLGNGTGGSGQFSASPVTVSDLTDAVAVAAGAAHSCALRATGSVVCWGSNDRGRLGDGTTTTPRLTPVPVVNPNGSTLRRRGRDRGGLRPHVRGAVRRHRALLGGEELRQARHRRGCGHAPRSSSRVRRRWRT